MSNENKGGSANTSPPQTPPPTDNKTAKISIDAALAENEALKNELKAVKDTNDELTNQLKAANDVLEAQEKAKIIGEILPRSKFTIEDLKDKDIEELQHIRITLDQAKLPTFKNIRLGPVGADKSKASNLTVGSLFVLDEKRKEGRS